jgi:predicted Zn-dependent protease
MSRFTRITQRHVSSLAAATVATALVACGGQRTPTTAQGIVATPPAASATPTVTPAAAVTPAAPTVSPDVSYETAESTLVAHRYPEALAMFEAYTTRKPDNPWGHYMLGIAAWRVGQLDRARQAFEDALDRDPKHVKSLVNLSRVLLEQGHADSALPHIQQAVAIDSGLEEGWRVLGRVQATLGQTDDALESYKTALRIDPKDVWAMNNMGLVLIEAGRYAEAIPPLARAVQLDSTRPVFANNLGTALERSGHLNDAAGSYRLALAADSTYAKARVSLERVDGRPDDPTASPLDLKTVGDQFAEEIASGETAGGEKH